VDRVVEALVVVRKVEQSFVIHVSAVKTDVEVCCSRILRGVMPAERLIECKRNRLVAHD
jgi:hypothetical protein